MIPALLAIAFVVIVLFWSIRWEEISNDQKIKAVPILWQRET